MICGIIVETMIKRVLSIGLVVLSLVCGSISAQSARIEVTGKGYPPKRNISEVRKRLLARRAAVVDAYRILSSILNGVSGSIAGGEGVLHTSGFIKGAEIKGVRYLPDGKVEVDLVLPVNFLEKGVEHETN